MLWLLLWVSQDDPWLYFYTVLSVNLF